MNRCHFVARSQFVRMAAASLAVLAVMIWFAGTPVHAQRGKPPNFGGIPQDTLDELYKVLAGERPKGVTVEMANGVLLSLVREEHAAGNPGCGVTGALDAVLKFTKLQNALQSVKDGPAEQEEEFIKLLDKSINDLADLWQNGPPEPGFFTVDAFACERPNKE